MEPSDDDDVVRRLRKASATARFVEAGPPDLTDTKTVDAIAESLLDWLYKTGEQEPFALLVEVSAPILDDLVLKTRRDHGLAFPSGDLVNAFFSELYLAVGAPRVASKAFLGAAATRIDEVAAEIAGLLGGGTPASNAGLLLADTLDGADELAGDEAERITESYRATLCQAFHSLGLDDRRILIARLIDQLPEADVASELNMPLGDVDTLCASALSRFEQRKAELLAAGTEGPS